MSGRDRTLPDDRLQRTLGVLRPREIAEGTCPAPELLAELDESRRGAGAGRALRAHLDACPSCAADREAHLRARDAAGDPPTQTHESPSLLDRLRLLVEITMPPSLAFTTRSAAHRERQPGYRAAMREYRDGRYAKARDQLLSALRNGEWAPELAFYLGACLLRAGRHAEARACLERAAQQQSDVGEYRWYLAQALLGEGRGEDALGELERAARMPGPRRTRASEQAAGLRRVLGREPKAGRRQGRARDGARRR